MLKQFVAGVAVAVMLTGVAVAGPFEDGVAAYKRGDYATALRLWRPLAEQGDADAQFNLGLMYANGEGVPQDYRRGGEVVPARRRAGPCRGPVQPRRHVRQGKACRRTTPRR